MDRTLAGKKIKLIRMEDPYTNLKPGDEGTIQGTDGLGQIMVNWDNGSTLSVIPEIDEYEISESKIQKKLNYLKTFESGEWDSSIKYREALEVVDKLSKYHKKLEELMDKEEGSFKLERMSDQAEDRLNKIYDKKNSEFVIDKVFYSEIDDRLVDDIIKVGDDIMSRFGTEPRMVINAFDDCFAILDRNGINIRQIIP